METMKDVLAASVQTINAAFTFDAATGTTQTKDVPSGCQDILVNAPATGNTLTLQLASDTKGLHMLTVLAHDDGSIVVKDFAGTSILGTITGPAKGAKYAFIVGALGSARLALYADLPAE